MKAKAKIKDSRHWQMDPRDALHHTNKANKHDFQIPTRITISLQLVEF